MLFPFNSAPFRLSLAKRKPPFGVVFFLTQSVGENPIRVADEGAVICRRAADQFFELPF